jgi:hypothetical protein
LTDTEGQTVSPPSIVKCSIIVLAVYLFFLWYLPALKRSELIFEDKFMYVATNDWVAGQRKNCPSLNEDLNQQTLACHIAQGKAYEVRLYGETRNKNKPETAIYHWDCFRDSRQEPSLTCKGH